MSSADISRFSGVGGFAQAARPAATPALSAPSVAGSVVGDSAAQDFGEESNDESSDDEIAAPLAKALKVVNGTNAEKKAESATEAADDDLCEQAEELLDFFATIIEFGDDKEMWQDQEAEMIELMKKLSKAVPAARKKSLVHIAKKLPDFSTKLKGAIMVWQKAKQYKAKKGNDASSSALHVTVALAKEQCPLVIF